MTYSPVVSIACPEVPTVLGNVVFIVLSRPTLPQYLEVGMLTTTLAKSLQASTFNVRVLSRGTLLRVDLILRVNQVIQIENKVVQYCVRRRYNYAKCKSSR